jgi:hypothetical protein
MRVSKLATLVIAAVFSMVASTAQAALWTNSAGSTAFFSWSNGGSDNGLFGSPVVSGNKFIFSPANFLARSQNGNAVTTSDRLFVDITITPGFQFGGLSISESGDYAILGGGSVQATGAMFVTNLQTGTVASAVMNTNPSMPISAAGAASGLWSGTMGVQLPDAVTTIRLVINNILQATSSPTGTAQIEKKTFGSDIVVELFIPEPGTITALVGLGGLLLARRRVA